MPRLFGTDGIRGVANVELKPTLAYALGRATAYQLVGKGGQLVVGQDTRRSGDMFVSAIAAGATSLGSDVRIAGCVPTPALAFLAGTGDFAAGIMVSASHNPADDNGLKVLDRQGLKLDDGIEEEIEQLIWRTEELGSVGNAEIGRAVVDPGLLDRYREHRLGLARTIDAGGLRIVLDCANGSGGVVGPEILGATGATVEVIHNAPDGININVASGATSPGSLALAVRERGADVGFALDGDADRLIAVDASGTVVDGDQVLGILALDRLERGVLPEGALVVSVLSNGGLQSAVEGAGGQIIRTPVGDKYILEG
ncbi:MAG TPA: phosphoglucosamine mutase, partial [Verrucomicrobiae bacterium]|nr:phosphoglucosamine mutase [Verrucomicrobiae bacterium]